MKIKKISPNKKELRHFGMIMAIIIPILFGIIIPTIFQRNHPFWPYIFSLVFVLSAIFFPVLLKPVYIAWMIFGKIIGFINFHIILTGIYILIFSPISLYFKLMGKDPMKRDYDEKTDSYRDVCFKRNKQHMEKPY